VKGGQNVAGFVNTMLANIRRGGTMLIVMIFMLFLGLFVGFAAPSTMDEEAAQRTRLYIGNYIQALPDTGISPAAEAWQAFLLNGAMMLALGLLGLHVFGLPLCAAMLFLRGLSIGYAMSFLLDYQGASGFVVIALSMLPPNLILLPLLVIGAVVAGNFSRTLLRNRSTNSLNLGVYGLRFLFLLIGVGLGSLVQGYICPLLLQLFFIII
jgi:stage II sporulation protein M